MVEEKETTQKERKISNPQSKTTTETIKTITIPIRVKDRPRRARANAAINVIKKQISKNLKGVDISKIRIGESINKAVFARGREKPPAKIKISIKKIKGKYYTEMYGQEIKQKKIEKKTIQQKKPQTGMTKMLDQMKKKAGIVEEESKEKGKNEEKIETQQEIKKKESEKVDKKIKNK